MQTAGRVLNSQVAPFSRAMNVPLFSGNVWKVCAQPTVVCRRNTVRPLEPATKMALIGKTYCRRHINRQFPIRQHLSGLCQAQLDKPGVRRKVKFALKAAGERKAIRPRLPRKV